jgi:hypothetical protein
VAKYSGENLVIKFGTTDISGAGRSLEVSESGTEIDVTTYGSTDREWLVTQMSDREGTYQVLDDSASTVIRNLLRPGISDSLTWFPIGTASGNAKLGVGTAVVRERNFSYPYDDAVVLNITFRLSGALIESTAGTSGL